MKTHDSSRKRPRPKAGGAWREGRTGFHHLFESMTQGVVCQSADGLITAANPAAERILGLTLDQMQGRTSMDPRWRALREDGSDLPGPEHPAMRALATGQPARGAVMAVFHPAENRHRWLLADAIPEFRPGERQPWRVYTTFADITERREAEQCLRESEAQFRRLYENSLMGLYRTSTDGRILLANPTLLAMLRCRSLDDLAKRNLEETGYHPHYPRHFFKEAIERDGIVRGLESAWTRADGTVVFVRESAQVVRGADGRVLYYEGVVEDISERKRAEEALRASEERYRAFVANSTEGIWRYEGKHPVSTALPAEEQIEQFLENAYLAECNDAFARMYGFDRAEEMIGASMRELAGHDPRNLEFLRAFIRSGYRLMDVESYGRNRHGEVSHFTNSFVGVVEHGHLVRAWGVQRDITQRKQVEAALQQSVSLLQAALESTADGLLVVDNSATKIASYNRQFAELWGVPQALLDAGDDPPVLAHVTRLMKDPEAFLARVRELFAQPEQDNFDVLELADGRVVERSSRPQRVEGRPVGRVWSFRDITARRRAEERLRASEAALSSIFHAAPTGMGLLSNRVFLQVNDRVCELTGFTRDELLGKNARMLYPTQEDYEFVGREKYRQIRERGVGTVETRWQRKDGRCLDILLSSSPVDASDPTRGITFTALDITERKRAERRQRAVLRIAEAALATENLDEFFRSIHATIGELMPARNFFIGLLDPAGGLLHFPYFEDERDPAPGPLKPAGTLAGYVLRTGKPLLATRVMGQRLIEVGEAKLVGSPSVDWLGVPLRTHLSKTIGVMVVQTYAEAVRLSEVDRDVLEFVSTQVAMAIERRQAEADAWRSQADLERAQAVGHIGSWVSEVPPSGTLVWSSETCRIFGIPEAEFDGRTETFFRLLHPDDAAAVWAASEAARRGDKPYDLEHRIVRPDGAVRWVHEKAEVERDAAGRPVGMVGVVQDVTQRRHLEEWVRRAQKMEAVGQLAGGVAHDFNNILTATLMQLRLLQENPSLDAQAREGLQELERGARRAADLTRQLLLFGRRSAMQLKLVDVNDLLTELERMLRRLLGEHIIFEVAGDTVLPWINADAGMIQQVVVNLAVNARDAMPNGGRLSIRTTAVEINADQARTRTGVQPGLHVCLSVSDTGCGMDAVTLQHIFEPFFTTKEVGKGTGLGLATVHGIVQQHAGWTEVQSEPGRGTTFRVFLPAFSAPTRASTETVPPRPITGGHETILLVEDEAAVRHVIGLFLRRWGYQVLEASDGAEALALWLQHSAAVDLLYTDVVMPGGLSGLELAEQLRTRKPGLKVILSSGYSAELVDAALSVTNLTYVPKPCPPAELAAAIRKCLESPDR